MSSVLQVRVVCEGPTDTIVIRSAFKAAGVDAVVTQIQPQSAGNLLGAQGRFGGGWKGVRGWCVEVAANVGLSQTLSLTDLLVVHVDADIASEKDVACDEPCPPAAAACDRVRTKVQEWLATTTRPARLVLCVPSRSTEAWVFTAIFPADRKVQGLECRDQPAALLVGKNPKLVRKKGKEYKKDEREYLAAIPALVAGWSSVSARCTQGDRFLKEIKAACAVVRLDGRS